jgi:hypothetical protein
MDPGSALASSLGRDDDGASLPDLLVSARGEHSLINGQGGFPQRGDDEMWA